MNQSMKQVALALHMSILVYGIVLYFLCLQTQAEDWTMGFRILADKQILTAVMAGLALMATSLAIFVKPLIIRMALAESVAIYGFIAAYLNFSFAIFFPFALWALILQIYVGPWIQRDEQS